MQRVLSGVLVKVAVDRAGRGGHNILRSLQQFEIFVMMQSIVGGKSLAEALLAAANTDVKAEPGETRFTLEGISVHKVGNLPSFCCQRFSNAPQ